MNSNHNSRVEELICLKKNLEKKIQKNERRINRIFEQGKWKENEKIGEKLDDEIVLNTKLCWCLDNLQKERLKLVDH